MALEVNQQSADVTGMGAEWPLLEALMGGTPKMRAANEKLLPKWPGETPDGYDARLVTATLFPAYRRTVAVMAGKPFSKPLTWSTDAPIEVTGAKFDADVPGSKNVEGWADDIDLEGVNLATFAAEMIAEALAYGICGILVEAPKPLATGSRPATKAEQNAAGVRPYFVRVKHDQILGWKFDRVNGRAVLTQLRILETTTVNDGDFGEKAVKQVRVLSPGAWEIYQQTGAGRRPWTSVDAGVSGLPVIPFVPLYGSRLAYMMGVSPLLDLGFLNVKHWQSQSDQDTILHVARVPILFAKGFADTDTITVGASTAVKTSSEAADMKWVEHSGLAIAAGKESLQDLEGQMIQAGAELLVKKPGQRTATESANDAEANKSDLQRIVEGFENGIDQALQFMADYAGLATCGSVSLFKGFGEATLSDASGQLILSMEQGGLISTETAINEFKRRGTLSDDVDPEEESEKVIAQGPALGAMADTPTDPNEKPPPGDESLAEAA